MYAQKLIGTSLVYTKWEQKMNKKDTERENQCTEKSENHLESLWSQSDGWGMSILYCGKDLWKRWILSIEWKSTGVMDDNWW